jgi:RHS repeat-associated protein
VVNNSPGKLNSGNTSAVSTALSPNVTNFLNNDRSYDNTKPKAYLNWIFFDNQFNFISGSSDAMQVDMTGSTGKKAMVPSLQTMPKNGYLYVYISNESNQNVYFDDITVRHTTGPLMQEQAYYPYGLEIQGLSDKALMKAATNYKYNAGSELEDEDGIGYYNTFYRKYDAQIGRFSGVDILAEKSVDLNPFHFGANNPAFYNDPYGDQFTSNGYNPQNGRSIKGPDNNFHAPWLAEIKWNDVGFFDWGNEGNASGNYSSIQGISSKYITSLFLGGNQFAKNKNGVYGFWIGGSFDPRDRGYKEAGGNKKIESEVVVGTNKKWVEFQNMGNNFGLSGGGFLDRIFKMGQFMQTGDKSTGETSDVLFGKTTTNKLSKEFDVINLGAWGDRLWTSTYGGKVSGKAGNLVNLDVSTNNFGVDGYSISVFGGLVTVGFATDLTLSGGIGVFGYELHGNIGFSQLGFGYSHTQDNGQIGGSDHNVRAGLGSLAVALVIASEGILGPFIAPALK